MNIFYCDAKPKKLNNETVLYFNYNFAYIMGLRRRIFPTNKNNVGLVFDFDVVFEPKSIFPLSNKVARMQYFFYVLRKKKKKIEKQSEE